MYTLKKSLGQHFLKDQGMVNRIFSVVKETDCSRLLEVGPGGGAITGELLTLPQIDFKAVELDREKVSWLLQKYPEAAGRIVEADFLQVEPPFQGEFVVVGNFPYNISTQILFKILDWKEQVPVVIGMFQKEVAERAASPSGSKVYGVLSALVQVWYDVEYLFDVPPSCFNPPPKVMSGVIRLTRKKQIPDMSSWEKYRTLVKAAFNQRRKTLRNALRPFFTTEVLEDEIFNKRAEQLGIQEFAALTFRMRS